MRCGNLDEVAQDMGLAGLYIVGEPALVAVQIAFMDQQFGYRSPNSFLSPPAKNGLRCGIEADQPALSVDAESRIQRRVDRHSQARLVFCQFQVVAGDCFLSFSNGTISF